MTIYEIAEQYKEFLTALEDIELDEEAIKDTLESFDGVFEEKADSYAKIISALNDDVDNIDKEIKRLQSRKTTIQNNIYRMKNVLMMVMKEIGKTKFKTSLYSFSVARNGGVPPVNVLCDPKDLPQEFQIIDIKADKKKIAEYLNNNPQGCRFAELGERGESLRIR